MATDRRKRLDVVSGEGCPVYNAQIHPRAAEKLYALGAEQGYVAEAFGLSSEALSEWENEHAEFYDFCKRGRAAAAVQIGLALHKLATGYVQVSERLMKVHGEIVRAIDHRHVPPSVRAMQLLLNKGTTTRDTSEDRARNFLQELGAETIFDSVAENEKKQNEGGGDD
jgi:hypothetical protein